MFIKNIFKIIKCNLYSIQLKFCLNIFLMWVKKIIWFMSKLQTSFKYKVECNYIFSDTVKYLPDKLSFWETVQNFICNYERCNIKLNTLERLYWAQLKVYVHVMHWCRISLERVHSCCTFQSSLCTLYIYKIWTYS